MKRSSVLEKVLNRIRPGEREKKESLEMFLKIQKFVRDEFGLPAELMGSIAKGTFLAGDKDMDVFVLFPKDTAREELENKGLEIGKSVFRKFNHGNYQVSYAEHPYTEGKVGEFHIEVVPAYAVESAEKIQSAVDRTPFHTAYVKANLRNSDDVLLLKKFLKGIGCYGSDLRRQGFSGYLCELCVMKYGGFEETLRALQGYRYQEIIDMGPDHSKHDVQKIRRTFSGQPMIFIDPVDRNRNVAAVVSEEKLARFMFYAGNFIEKPQAEYFFPKEEKLNPRETMSFYEKIQTTVVAVTFRKPELIEDIMYPQLRRLAGNLAMHANHAGFSVMDMWVFADEECGIALELRARIIPEYFIVAGPTVFNPREHQKKFASTHSMAWFRKERFFSLAKRGETDVVAFVSKELKRGKKSMHDRGIPDNFIAPIRSGARIILGKQVLKIKSREFWLGAGKERVK